MRFSQVGDVVAIIVPEGMEKPYSCGAGYYRCLDATTQKMSHDELRIMFSDNEPTPFEEKTIRRFTFGDISKAKMLAFVKEASIHIGATAVSEFLRSLKVADDAREKRGDSLLCSRRL